MKMRQHPHMLATQKALLALWSTDDDAAKGGEVVDLSRPLCYIDRLRVRVPGNETNLRGHIDSGSINRWTDELYRYVNRRYTIQILQVAEHGNNLSESQMSQLH